MAYTPNAKVNPTRAPAPLIDPINDELIAKLSANHPLQVKSCGTLPGFCIVKTIIGEFTGIGLMAREDIEMEEV